MPTIPKPLAELIASQDGLVRRSQALRYISEGTLRQLLIPGGRWCKVVRGVYAAFTGQLIEHQRRRAALLYAAELTDVGAPDEQRPEADLERIAITGLEGCRIRGFLKVPATDTITVLVEHARRRQSRGFVVVERTRRFPASVGFFNGLPVAPTARCLMDAARVLTELDSVRALLMDAVQRRRVPPRLLHEELAVCTKQGTALPRRVLEELSRGALSVPEAKVANLFGTSKVLPPAHHNCALTTLDGEFLAVADGYFDDVGLATEVQSVAHHLLVEEQDADMARRTVLAKHGVGTAEIRPAWIDSDPGKVLADVEAVYLERRGQGSRPKVLVRCRPGCRVRAA